MDEFFGTDMQKARGLCEGLEECDSRLGVIDTMHDLILDAMGTLIACIIGFIYLKRKKFIFFDKFFDEFVKY